MSATSRRPDDQLLQSVRNALRILRMLKTRPTVKAPAIGEELNLGRSTVHRLLATLESEGFVQRDHLGNGYRAGRELITVGIAAVGDIDVRKKAREHMEALSATTGETVHMFIPEGSNTRIIDGVEGSRPVRVATAIGALYPAHATAGGKALLAALPPEQLDSLFPRGLPRLTSATTVDRETLAAEIGRIRKQGYAVNRGESTDEVCGIAVPILDKTRRVVASLALAIPQSRMDDERTPGLAHELRCRADRIGETLI
ncbi:MAG: IclR family transcriptional regulator [Micropruina sp.]|uniref:IclR family transcriptional regulator n=1 Tax=Micropruina sp. TaxID=2737536 RepID=UPI0039E5B7BB